MVQFYPKAAEVVLEAEGLRPMLRVRMFREERAWTLADLQFLSYGGKDPTQALLAIIRIDTDHVIGPAKRSVS